MSSLPQRLQAEVIIGRQLLQDLLRHVVHGLEKESEEKRWADILDGTFGNTVQKCLSAKGFFKIFFRGVVLS